MEDLNKIKEELNTLSNALWSIELDEDKNYKINCLTLNDALFIQKIPGRIEYLISIIDKLEAQKYRKAK